VHLDPETDEVTVSHDERCMGMQFGFVAESGNAYWFSDHDASMEWSVQGRAAPHDCALRLRAGESSFDDEWELDLTDRTGGRSAVASVAAGGSRVWDRSRSTAASSRPPRAFPISVTKPHSWSSRRPALRSDFGFAASCARFSVCVSHAVVAGRRHATLTIRHFRIRQARPLESRVVARGKIGDEPKCEHA
jgi:hypothetical protein